jgi:hypothetical protein
MAEHHAPKAEFVSYFKFDQPIKKFLWGLIGLGFLLTLIGIVAGAIGGEYPEAGSGGHGHGTEAHAGGHGGGEPSGEGQAQGGSAHGEAHAQSQSQAGPESHADGHGGGHSKGKTPIIADATGGSAVATMIPNAPLWLSRLMVNIIQNSFFFMSLSVLCLFFLAVSYAANAGWFVIIHRIPEALTRFIPIGWGILMLMFLLQLLGVFDLYPWLMNWEGVHNHHFIHALEAKGWYLNTGFFLLRQAIIIVAWLAFDYFLRRFSTEEDVMGGTQLFRKRRMLSGAFILVFALTYSMASFDWMLALDARFFSTMYAVHTFASVFVSAMALITVIAVLLKATGYLPQFNENHMHDLGKFVFGFSIFWTYIWFGEFLLIWYGNLPEESFFYERIMETYPGFFAINLVLNFILPLLGLMTNTSKRKMLPLVTISSLVFLGHWFDFYLFSAPSVIEGYGGLGLLEVGTFALFLGGFLYTGLKALTQQKLVPEKHPYLQESLLHESL